MENMNHIYLDNAATTALDPKVIEAMNKSFEYFGNPSSLHTFGQEARKLVDEAHDFVAFFLDCKPTEVIFTSGGSESDNLAIKGVISALETSFVHGHPSQPISLRSNRHSTKDDFSGALPHVITSAIEHHAVLHTVQDLEKEGRIEATYIKPNKKGIVQVSDIESAIKPNTVLVSVMYVNNETGCVQPIREIGKLIEKKNESRSNRIYFHTDAVQAAEFFEMGTKYLHVDLLTLTAHKIHGPKGTGVLFVKKGTPITPQITGGDHEFRMRAGTENVSGIVGLMTSMELIIRRRADEGNLGPIETDPAYPIFKDKTAERVAKLRDKLEKTILKTIPETYLNGDKEKRSPSVTNISFKNAEGEAIILNLDFLGIAVSSGSACTARSLDPSHVLLAMDTPRELSHGAIRFSLSRETTEEEIDKVLEVLPPIINKLREMSPFK